MLKKVNLLIASISLISSVASAQAVDSGVMATLFTTVTERQLINANRYKSNTTVKQTTQVSEPKETTVTVRETIQLQLQVSGITHSESGQDIAWVNGKAYENGSKLEDGTRLIIASNQSGEVVFKTPDGKRHAVKVGKKKQIEYLKPLDKG